MNVFLKHRKRIIFFAALGLAFCIVLLGGVKLMIYFLLLITGIFLGIHFERFKRLYLDYKLSLRVNSIITSTKQYEQQEKEIERLKSDLNNAMQRASFYQAGAARNFVGGQMNGDFGSNGASRFGQDE